MTGHTTIKQDLHVNPTHYHIAGILLITSISSYRVSIMNSSMAQSWILPLVPLYLTCSWKSLKPKPSALPPPTKAMAWACGGNLWHPEGRTQPPALTLHQFHLPAHTVHCRGYQKQWIHTMSEHFSYTWT